ncbi:TPA: hypothetical protein ACW0Q5_002971 [Klebsiella pneumoniae]|uniref:hypothetical protein n=1 Tax=Enterobacteriaceae TaxID=543 RepID=UPI000E680705|nr:MULTISPECIES: hypothetical protein [Enterobacteriaceae]RIU55386.1 hypothetical protein D1615_21525 [Klebsiella pneumoniae]TXQ48764.1 hypothetical protein FV297_04625 [Escherichia coli]
MNMLDEDKVYGFVSGDMQIWPDSNSKDRQDLLLIATDMETIKILASKGIGNHQTSFGVTLNESKALMLGTRLAYCCSCGRFSDRKLDNLKEKIVEDGVSLCPRYFNQAMSEAVRFATLESDFMRQQSTW